MSQPGQLSRLHDDLFSEDPKRQFGVLSAMSMLTPAALQESDVCCVDRLVELTASDHSNVSSSAAEILETGVELSASDVRPLCGLMRAHADDDAGYWAATMLGRLAMAGQLKDETSPTISTLLRCLQDSDYVPVLERATWALGRIGRPALEVMPALRRVAEMGPPRLRRLAVEALESIRGVAA